jgi:RHS repeat-associated protein
VAAIRDHAGNTTWTTTTVWQTVVTNAVYSYNTAGCVTNIRHTGYQYQRDLRLNWDSQYQLTEALTNSVSVERYGYDPVGRRIYTVNGNVTNWHVYTSDQIVADVNSTGGVIRSYTWGPGIDNLLAMTVRTGSVAKTYYTLTDHLGTVHALMDTNGIVVESYTFDAWGRVLSVQNSSGQSLSISGIGNRYLWQGREYSWNTGLYYFRARWYDPVVGRWLSNDPIGISGGLNQYVFAGNNPVNFRDPYGLEAYYVSGTSHAFVIVTDPRSRTGYTSYSFEPGDGGYGRGLPILDKLTEMLDALHCPGRMVRTDSVLPGNAIRLYTTSEEDCSIRKKGDELHSNPGSYNAAFRNCAYVARDILSESDYMEYSPNTLGMIYTPDWVADTVRTRAKYRVNAWRMIGKPIPK